MPYKTTPLVRDGPTYPQRYQGFFYDCLLIDLKKDIIRKLVPVEIRNTESFATKELLCMGDGTP